MFGQETIPAKQIADAPTLGQVYAVVTEILSVLRQQHKANYTIREVAEMTGRSDYTVRRWVHEGRLAAIRIDGSGPKGRLLIAYEEVKKLLDGDATILRHRTDFASASANDRKHPAN